jgi:hypothetical protein
MRILVPLVIVALVIGGVLSHRSKERAAEQAPTAQSQAAAPRETSKHNWAKSALDRTGDLKRQVAAQQKEDGVR